MDRASPLVTFSLFYMILGILNVSFNTPPSHLQKKKKWDYLGQHISLIHSVLAILISLYVYISESGINYTSETRQSHIIVISHTLGYFFYDMVFAELFALHDWAMRTHHICVLIGGTIMYIAEYGGSPASICILITEGSNPFILLRKIMKAKGLEKNFSYKIIELIFAISFIFFRAFVCSFINYNMWLARVPFLTKLTISITYAVGFFWIYAILNIAAKRIDENSGNALGRVLESLKKNWVFWTVFLAFWAIAVPNIAIHGLGLGFINLVVSGFVVL